MRAPTRKWSSTTTLSHILRQLQNMDQREATVLRMRFGLDDNEPRTLKEIGESLGLTRERVRQSSRGPRQMATASNGVQLEPMR